ncbi:MAG: phosphoglucomutase/phosphomannomutase family protein [Dehalococcoidales bacterium]|nr:phosphoglucomutase/phosphomannomutase family protein [Dehalococcoidales bacterium]
MNNPIKFGTDGWRAVIAGDFTFDNVRLCAQGVADYLKNTGLASRGVMIGYDHRFASEDFAAATAEVLAGNGIHVYLSPKAIPTPMVCFGVLLKQTGGGVVITASHNPARWNGFKYREANGASVSTETANDLETFITKAAETEKIRQQSLANALDKQLIEYLDLVPPYVERINRLVDLKALNNAGLKIAVDSMYGVGAGYFKMLLGDGNNKITEINGERNPAFPGINPEPIAKNLINLTALVKKQKANIGLATDGDADRVGIMDEHGCFLTQLQTFALLALYLLEIRRERGAIVKTVTSTGMLDRLGELYKVPVIETQVGFKYVAPYMIEQNALIGGEESGGYGFRGHVPERDAIPAGLFMLDFMLKTGKTPSQLLSYLYSKVGEHYYDRSDLKFPAEKRGEIIKHIEHAKLGEINGVKVTKTDTVDGFRYILADNSWLLIRFSGTEPVLRVYAEADDMEKVKRILIAGRELTGV